MVAEVEIELALQVDITKNTKEVYFFFGLTKGFLGFPHVFRGLLILLYAAPKVH